MTFSIPSDFWEEFDRRLDAKLDAKLDARDKIFEQRFNKIDERLSHIDGWIKRQNNGIEYELTAAIKQYLKEHHVGYYTVEPTIFPKELQSSDGKTITEFDGILILTNDEQHANSLSKYLPQQTTSISPDTVAYIVIVEAKQHVTTEKINIKIRQKTSIERLLADIKENRVVMPKRLSKVGIQYIKGVRLYIGGIDIDKHGRETFMAYCKSDPMCGLIEQNGNRFGVHNATNDFGNVQFGGRRKLIR